MSSSEYVVVGAYIALSCVCSNLALFWPRDS